MTVIENINIAYVSQDLSLLSCADADGTKDLRYLSVFAIGCMILPLREDRRNCLFNGWVNSFRIVLAFFTAWSSYRQSICVSVLFTNFSDYFRVVPGCAHKIKSSKLIGYQVFRTTPHKLFGKEQLPRVQFRLAGWSPCFWQECVII